MKLICSPLALERVVEIAAYIGAERPRAAESWVEETFGAVKRLGAFPLSGRIVPELGREDVREVIRTRSTDDPCTLGTDAGGICLCTLHQCEDASQLGAGTS